MCLDKTIPVRDILAHLRIKKTTFYKYVKIKATKPSARPNEQKTLVDARHQAKTIKLTLFLQVENNSNFVCGKGKVRQQIEDWVLSEYHMEHGKTNDWEYTLTIQYDDEKDLDQTIEGIIAGMYSIADSRYCFIEAHFYSLERERSYPFAE